MACCASRLRALANPHRISILLLAFTIGLLTLTILPPSSDAYLVRVDSRTKNGDSALFTTWFSSRGYCTASASHNVLSVEQCYGGSFGYAITKALSFENPDSDGSGAAATAAAAAFVNIPDADVWSNILTRPPIVLTSIIILLCFISMVAHKRILAVKPRALMFGAALVCSVLANILSSILLGFELLLETVLATGSPAPGTRYAISVGPLGYAVKAACIIQLVACAVSFYTCIGGKYRCEGELEGECEGGIRLGEEDAELAMPRMSTSTSDEKYPLRG